MTKLPNYSTRLQKAAIKFKLSGPQIVAELGKKMMARVGTGNVRRVETTLKLWSNAGSLGDHSGGGSLCATPQYIAAININCAVPVNLVTFLIDLTFMFSINFNLHIILENRNA